MAAETESEDLSEVRRGKRVKMATQKGKERERSSCYNCKQGERSVYKLVNNFSVNSFNYNISLYTPCHVTMSSVIVIVKGDREIGHDFIGRRGNGT